MKRKIIICAILLLGIIVIALSGNGSAKATAEQCIKETKKIDNVDTISGAVCSVKEYNGDEDKRLGVVVFYIDKSYTSSFAYFEDGLYKGDGSNGGEARNYEDETFYNMHALNAAQDSLEYILEKNLPLKEYEDLPDSSGDVVYVNIFDLETWADNL